MSTFEELYKQIEHCQDCTLGKYRTRAVPGEGLETAEILFIGEAPGWNEDQQGRPFVGAAGLFLTSLLSSIGLNRNQVYIANVIKCRPPGNRDPLPGEIQSCSKYLEKQIELIKPKLIVTLGRYSMARYFPNETIGKIHGKSKEINGITYFAMYHPAAALHQNNLKSVIEEDMRKIPPLLEKIREAAKSAPPAKAAPEQEEKLLARQEEKKLIETQPAPAQIEQPSKSRDENMKVEIEAAPDEEKSAINAEEQRLPEDIKKSSMNEKPAVREDQRAPDALEPKQLNLF